MSRVAATLLVLALLCVAPQATTAQTASIGAVPVLTGLAFPGAFTVAPDGRIFYAVTYAGEIHLFDPGTGSDTLFFTLSGGIGGDQGLLGLALPPTYPSLPFVFAYVARTVQGTLVNQIVRIRDRGGTGTQPKIIYQSNSGTEHLGGRIQFGPDGLLYAVVGDGGDPANAQDLAVTNGKVLRMTAGGQVPPDNPFAGSLVWAYGIRNSFGFDFDAQTGFLWEEDNGPECNDEVNMIRKGGNYGWGPTETCSTPPPPPRNTNQDGPHPILPAEFVPTPTAPTGLGFCEGCGLAGAEGAMFYGTFNTSNIHRVELSGDRRRIAADTVAYSHSSVVLSIERGPDGTLYFSDDTGIYRLVQV